MLASWCSYGSDRLLNLHPEHRAHLASFSGKTLGLQCGPFRGMISVDGENIHWGAWDKDQSCDASLEGSPEAWSVALRALFRGEAWPVGRSVTIGGDIGFLFDFLGWLRAYHPDLEGLLAEHLGDPLAVGAVTLIRAVRETLQSVAREGANALLEYATYEQPLWVSPQEYRAWCLAVGRLRDDVERLLQRVERLLEASCS